MTTGRINQVAIPFQTSAPLYMYSFLPTFHVGIMSAPPNLMIVLAMVITQLCPQHILLYYPPSCVPKCPTPSTHPSKDSRLPRGVVPIMFPQHSTVPTFTPQKDSHSRSGASVRLCNVILLRWRIIFFYKSRTHFAGSSGATLRHRRPPSDAPSTVALSPQTFQSSAFVILL